MGKKYFQSLKFLLGLRLVYRLVRRGFKELTIIYNRQWKIYKWDKDRFWNKKTKALNGRVKDEGKFMENLVSLEETLFGINLNINTIIKIRNEISRLV